MIDTPNDNQERRLRFVAKKYREKSLDANMAWKQFAAEHGIGRSIALRRYLIGTAVVLFGVIGFGTLYLVEREKPKWVVIATDTGQWMDVLLPDSSQVSIAGNSQIRYDKRRYGKEGRAVEMNGKAFFQVQRDEASPFSVQTKETDILVVGTSFQVTEQDLLTSVYVETGTVSFTVKELGEEVLLTAGMSADYSVKSGEITIYEKGEPNFLSWKTRLLSFCETPLDKVIHDLCDCYQVSITGNTDVTNLTLTATFNDMPLDEVLFIINQTLDITLQVSP